MRKLSTTLYVAAYGLWAILLSAILFVPTLLLLSLLAGCTHQDVSSGGFYPVEPVLIISPQSSENPDFNGLMIEIGLTAEDIRDQRASLFLTREDLIEAIESLEQPIDSENKDPFE